MTRDQPGARTYVVRLRQFPSAGRPVGTVHCLETERRIPVSSWSALRRELGLGPQPGLCGREEDRDET